MHPDNNSERSRVYTLYNMAVNHVTEEQLPKMPTLVSLLGLCFVSRMMRMMYLLSVGLYAVAELLYTFET